MISKVIDKIETADLKQRKSNGVSFGFAY